MTVKQRHCRKGSHWAKRNLQEIKSENAAGGIEKTRRQTELSALPLASRVPRASPTALRNYDGLPTGEAPSFITRTRLASGLVF